MLYLLKQLNFKGTNMIKVGDIVKVFDFSYSLNMIDGRIKITLTPFIKSNKWEVVLIEGFFPSKRTTFDFLEMNNNVMLRNTDDKNHVLFSQERFIGHYYNKEIVKIKKEIESIDKIINTCKDTKEELLATLDKLEK